MKKLFTPLLTLFLATLTLPAYSQIFGIKGGLNISTLASKNADYKINPGVHAGATAEFPISENFSFETGMLLSTKGYRSQFIFRISLSELTTIETSAHLLYLDFPVNARVAHNIGDIKLFGMFGPYLGVGLTGIAIVRTEKNDTSDTERHRVKFGSDKRLDFGLSASAGIEINAFQISLSYGLGLVNMATSALGSTIKNRVLSLSVGYKFRDKTDK